MSGDNEPNDCCVQKCNDLDLSNKVIGTFEIKSACNECGSRLLVTYTVHPAGENQISIDDIHVVERKSAKVKTAVHLAPLRAGNTITIKDTKGKVLKSGKLAANPSNSIYPFNEPRKDGIDKYTYYFEDTVYVVENEAHSVDVHETGKGYIVPKKEYF